MKVNSVGNQQNFEGKVVLKNKISVQQNSLFNKHKSNLDKMIEEMPFDLFVEQSKSKKTISLSTNVEGTASYFVRKNEQNFEEMAGYAIAEGKQKSPIYKKMVKVNEMFNYQKMTMLNIVSGNFKEARESEKQLAKLAVQDFDTFKEIPHIKFTDVPFDMGKQIIKQGVKYRLYRAFSPKTNDEKQFLKMKKDYYNELKAKNEKPKVSEIKLPKYYF